MAKSLPTDDIEFESLMQRVDADLASEGIPIPFRPIRALGVIGKEFNATIRLSKPYPNEGPSSPNVTNWPFAERTYRWFDKRYGKRLLHDPRPGKIVFILQQAPWVLFLPRMFGQVQVVASRTLTSERFRNDGVPPIYNVLEGIEGLTEEMKRSLTDDELRQIFALFQLGYNALTTMEYLCKNVLVESAMTDINTTVEHIMARNPSYGQSRWASLQATEKVLKASIELKGGTYSHTHDLRKILLETSALGIPSPSQEDIDAIQCTASARYGTESTTLGEAVTAHHASLRVCLMAAEYVHQSSHRGK